MNRLAFNTRIVIMGAGDRGTAAALRLYHSGFQPILLEQAQPSDLHFIRNFSDVIYSGHKTLDNVQAGLVTPAENETEFMEQLRESSANAIIAVINKMSAGDQAVLQRIKPEIIIDCTRSFSQNMITDLNWSDYPCVIRIGFSYNVGADGHYIIGDSQHYLGQVFSSRHQFIPDQASDDTVLKSPLSGVFQSNKRIGEEVKERETIGSINNINIMAAHSGFITGLLHSGHFVQARQPLFELISYQKPRESLTALPANCWSIAGGILEAVLRHLTAKTHT